MLLAQRGHHGTHNLTDISGKLKLAPTPAMGMVMLLKFGEG